MLLRLKDCVHPGESKGTEADVLACIARLVAWIGRFTSGHVICDPIEELVGKWASDRASE